MPTLTTTCVPKAPQKKPFYVRIAGNETFLEVAQWAVAEHPAKELKRRPAGFATPFATVMDKYQAQAVATAHHQDDLAETVLMKLIRGGRIEQLGALELAAPFQWRTNSPLLALNKQDLRRYAGTIS